MKHVHLSVILCYKSVFLSWYKAVGGSLHFQKGTIGNIIMKIPVNVYLKQLVQKDTWHVTNQLTYFLPPSQT